MINLWVLTPMERNSLSSSLPPSQSSQADDSAPPRQIYPPFFYLSPLHPLNSHSLALRQSSILPQDTQSNPSDITTASQRALEAYQQSKVKAESKKEETESIDSGYSSDDEASDEILSEPLTQRGPIIPFPQPETNINPPSRIQQISQRVISVLPIALTDPIEAGYESDSENSPTKQPRNLIGRAKNIIRYYSKNAPPIPNPKYYKSSKNFTYNQEIFNWIQYYRKPPYPYIGTGFFIKRENKEDVLTLDIRTNRIRCLQEVYSYYRYKQINTDRVIFLNLNRIIQDPNLLPWQTLDLEIFVRSTTIEENQAEEYLKREMNLKEWEEHFNTETESIGFILNDKINKNYHTFLNQWKDKLKLSKDITVSPMCVMHPTLFILQYIESLVHGIKSAETQGILKTLFEIIEDGKSTCSDNAVISLNKAITEILIHESRDDASQLLALGLKCFKEQLILENFSRSAYEGKPENVEDYLFRMLQMSDLLDLRHPGKAMRHYSIAFNSLEQDEIEGRDAENPSLRYALKRMFDNINIERITEFLCHWDPWLEHLGLDIPQEDKEELFGSFYEIPELEDVPMGEFAEIQQHSMQILKDIRGDHAREKTIAALKEHGYIVNDPQYPLPSLFNTK